MPGARACQGKLSGGADPLDSRTAGPADTPAAGRRRTWRFRLWLVNLLLGTWIGGAWIAHAPPDLPPNA